ncbi:MAG: sialidase, partial [Halobacteriota archaeon]
LGGQLASGTGPAVCAQNANSLDAFVQGTDHVLWHKSFQGSAWPAWGSLGGSLTSSPAATSPANGVSDVFVRGTDGAVWERGA